MRLTKEQKEDLKHNYDEVFKIYLEMKKSYKQSKFDVEVLEYQNKLDKNSEDVKKVLESLDRQKKELRSLKRYLDIAKKENEANE